MLSKKCPNVESNSTPRSVFSWFLGLAAMKNVAFLFGFYSFSSIFMYFAI